MKAFIFPGQGAQFEGMGKDLYDSSEKAKSLFEKANDILGFLITDVMFEGTKEDLKQTKVTQPAIFLHSVITSTLRKDAFIPDVVAGHSLGEFSALAAIGVLTFEDGLKLVSARALAMQAACEEQESTMAAILGLDDEVVEKICGDVDDIVVPANYNCPGQLVISGSISGVEKACELLKEAGARRALILPVGGAFHSPLMEPARERLEEAISRTEFSISDIPVYQNVTAAATTDPEMIKANLILQLTAPVRWTQTLKNMLSGGVTHFTEVGGTGRVLQGMVKKVDRSIPSETL